MTYAIEIFNYVAAIVDDVAGGLAPISANEIVDTNLSIDDDKYDGGLLYITGGGANFGSYRIVTWDEDNSKWTFTPALTPDATYRSYFTMQPGWTHLSILNAINLALISLWTPLKYSTDIGTTVAYQEEYDLPDNVYNIKRLEVAQTDDLPYNWQKHLGWEEFDLSGASTIRLNRGREFVVDGDQLRVWYQTKHETVDNLTTDTINNRLDAEMVAWTAAVHALRWRDRMLRGQDPHVTNALNEAIIQSARLRSLHEIPEATKDIVSGGW